MSARLGKGEISQRLEELDGWELKDGFITKTFEFKTFMAGIEFVNDLAAIAEKEEHHPDIHIRYTTITLSIQTHDAGGITRWDFELAHAIEKFLSRNPRKAR